MAAFADIIVVAAAADPRVLPPSIPGGDFGASVRKIRVEFSHVTYLTGSAPRRPLIDLEVTSRSDEIFKVKNEILWFEGFSGISPDRPLAGISAGRRIERCKQDLASSETSRRKTRVRDFFGF